MLAEGLEKNGNTPKTGGGFSDLWEGTYNGKKVAIKVLRLHVAEDSLPAKKVRLRQISITKRLKLKVLAFL
jgi:hypothetical protein